ncbi:MAG: hypothetical protein KGZ39_08135 [Simkania sp.]|nr:hypothetical protein [Simkania sp.]
MAEHTIKNTKLHLQDSLEREEHEDYPVKSRLHPLRSFGKKEAHCFVKREDELGFSISGTKFRKYRTLIPFLKRQECNEAVVIGGAYSNHVLSITQLLIENGIKPTLFLKGPLPYQKHGNFRFLQMLIPDSSIHWVPKTNWPKVTQYASAYADGSARTVILPEGATVFPAFLGGLSLPLDILRNEEEHKIEFDHLFIEVGTGFSAAALLLGFAYLKKKTFCHLLLLAGTEEEFLKQLQILHADFERWLGQKCSFPIHFSCESSSLAPSFGSTNSELFQFLIRIAREEGFFLDPIYSGKLFYHAKKKMEANPFSGNILVVHSGGALTLAGFQDQLETNSPS